jgi:hypothetical protein
MNFSEPRAAVGHAQPYPPPKAGFPVHTPNSQTWALPRSKKLRQRCLAFASDRSNS